MAKKKIVRLRRQDQLSVQIPFFIVIVAAICLALLPTIITLINSLKTQSEINLMITLLLHSSTLPQGTFFAFVISIFTMGYDVCAGHDDT